MKETLAGLIDKPVVIRTLPQNASWKPSTGIVFEVRNDAVDLMTSSVTMTTIQISMIVDVHLDHDAAKDMILEDPPNHPDYPKAKRLLFEAEQGPLLKQPAEATKAKARQAAELFRGVRAQFPKHLWTEQMLQTAHFIVTGAYDYEKDEKTTSGELENFDYQWAKARVEKLDAAMKARRPEDEVAEHISRVARHAGRALAKYPNHADLKAWFEKAEKIRTRLSEDTRKSNKITEPFVAGKD